MHGKQHAGFVNTLRSENDLAKNASSRGAPSGSFAFATMAAGLNWGSQRKGSFPSPVPKTGRTAIGPKFDRSGLAETTFSISRTTEQDSPAEVAAGHLQMNVLRE